MVNMFLACLFAVLSLQVFTMSYRLNGINRSFISMPIAVIEKAIVLYASDTDSLYIDRGELEKSVETYISKEVGKYSRQYSLNYYYYSTSDGLICKTSTCDGVRITLIAQVVYTFNYQKTMFYELRRN